MQSIRTVFFVLSLSLLASAFPGSPKDSSAFIVNGRDADIADFPHHLGLFDQVRYFCGASVLSRLWALSASHCLDLNTPPELVSLNSYYLVSFLLTSDIQINLWGGSTSRVSGGHLFFVVSYHYHVSYRICNASGIPTHSTQYRANNLGP